MPGILYIVATPIGNLDDMPPRVAATFGAADFVAAELLCSEWEQVVPHRHRHRPYPDQRQLLFF